jgi:hypothetical protein
VGLNDTLLSISKFNVVAQANKRELDTSSSLDLCLQRDQKFSKFDEGTISMRDCILFFRRHFGVS